MDSVKNLFFIIIFLIFVFYWFENVMKNKEKYIYISFNETK